MTLILPATQLLDTGIDRLTIFDRGLVDVCVKFSGGAGQAGADGVVADVRVIAASAARSSGVGLGAGWRR